MILGPRSRHPSSYLTHKWYIKNSTNGYLIQDRNNGNYLFTNPGLALDLKTEGGTEFLFDGNDNDGYYILYAADPVYALEIENGSDASGSKVLLYPSRRQRWQIKAFEC
ncbi:ricin-type beta-trefoil lectin domain protein [Ceratobasidium sp. AG-Ba]|nr:ricin-type beta-trefoil lectin domain protein [Ceratobasidium sp. AG-Ba]